jgi:hypothetical protein
LGTGGKVSVMDANVAVFGDRGWLTCHAPTQRIIKEHSSTVNALSSQRSS